MRRSILFSIVFFCSISQAQWVALTSGTTQNLRSIRFNDLQTGYACGLQGTILKTTNGGANWVSLNSGTFYELRSIRFINSLTGFTCGFSGPSGGIILRTVDGGTSWQQVYSSSAQLLALSFANNLNGISAGNSGTTLYTTNGGSNWLVGQPTGFLVTFYTAFMLNSSTGYCAGVNTIFSPLFAKTTNGGANWTYSSFMVNNNEATLHNLFFFNEQNGMAVSVLWNGQGGISRTTNGGQNWTHQIVTPALYGIDFPGVVTGYIAGANGALLKSTDGGNNWSTQISGISSFLRTIDFVDSLTGFAAGDGGIILKTTNGGVLGFSQINNEVPEEFALSQNYPNPFNPVTSFKFQVPSSGLVKIIVYDILGRGVQTLVNEQLKPGIYEVDFDGSNLPSGVYYYKLTAGNYSETKKMVLIK